MEQDSKETANGIILNIARREKSDTFVPPSMIAVVLLAYVAVVGYYSVELYRRYTVPMPLAQMFGLIALFSIGVGLIMAIFYILMSRNVRHSERERELRHLMIAYAEANSRVCGADLSGDIAALNDIDGRIDAEEDARFNPRKLLWICVPAVIGMFMLVFTGTEKYALWIVAACYALSFITAMLLAPGITVFPHDHEKRTAEFYDRFGGTAECLGLKTVRYEKRIGYRSFWLFLALTVVTLGVFLVYWAFLTFDDMNRHFSEQWHYEDSLFISIRETEVYFVENNVRRGKDYKLEDHWT